MNNLEFQTKILSDYFGIDKKEFKQRNILNPTFNRDVRLFIDPMLLKTSSYEIFNTIARDKYEKFFNNLCDRILITKELQGIDKEKAQKGIIQDLRFSEQKGLCLGFSRYSTSGRGTGKEISKTLFNSAEKLICKGSENTGIFSVLFLLEEGFGPDYISDMTAHIIVNELAIFTETIASDLKIPTREYLINGIRYNLPKHPLYNTYLFFVPKDILSPLNNVLDAKDTLERFSGEAEDNDFIRQRINHDIADILQKAAKNKSRLSELKKEAKNYILDNETALSKLRTFINEDKKQPYDFNKDILGIDIIAQLTELFQEVKPIIDTKKCDEDIIDDIISGFVNNIENNNKILRDLENKKEDSWQNAFFLYCKRTCAENNIDISPEAETGLGPVDFKLSRGHNFKILIEMKLSSNPQYLKGLEKQLEAYKKCFQQVKKSYYLYIDIEQDSLKSDERKQKLLNKKKELNIDSNIIFINGKIKPSASKLK